MIAHLELDIAEDATIIRALDCAVAAARQEHRKSVADIRFYLSGSRYMRGERELLSAARSTARYWRRKEMNYRRMIEKVRERGLSWGTP